MIFTQEMQIVKNYLLLIQQGIKTIEEVPDIYNLKEVVQQCLSKLKI